MLAHSRQLVPALKNLAGIAESRFVSSSETSYLIRENLEFFVSCAEDHLRTYVDIWKLIQDHRRKNREIERAVKDFCCGLMEKLERARAQPRSSLRIFSGYHTWVSSHAPVFHPVIFDLKLE